MQKLFILCAFVWFAACSKSSNNFPGSPDGKFLKRSFFKTAEQAFALVKKYATKANPEEKLQAIESISYTYSGNKVYAIVFYTTDRKLRNMVISREYNGEELIGGDVTTCDGESCDCLVRVVIDPNGHVTVGCSCLSCKKIISQSIEE